MPGSMKYTSSVLDAMDPENTTTGTPPSPDALPGASVNISIGEEEIPDPSSLARCEIPGDEMDAEGEFEDEEVEALMMRFDAENATSAPFVANEAELEKSVIHSPMRKRSREDADEDKDDRKRRSAVSRKTKRLVRGRTACIVLEKPVVQRLARKRSRKDEDDREAKKCYFERNKRWRAAGPHT
jgi:hypothetical protein